jgi:hypothetical protein
MIRIQKRKIVLGFILLFFVVKSSYSQVYQGDEKRWYVGGTLGLSVGSVISISIMPEVAYAITEKLFVGGGLRYSYYKDNRYSPAYQSTIWGGKLFTRYYILDDVFLHLEAERLYFEDPYYNNMTSDKWIYRDYFYGGGGYRQWVGPNSYMTIELLFDLTNNDYSFGSNPIFRMGFGIGL